MAALQQSVSLHTLPEQLISPEFSFLTQTASTIAMDAIVWSQLQWLV
jgi:hypothetical protein